MKKRKERDKERQGENGKRTLDFTYIQQLCIISYIHMYMKYFFQQR